MVGEQGVASSPLIPISLPLALRVMSLIALRSIDVDFLQSASFWM